MQSRVELRSQVGGSGELALSPRLLLGGLCTSSTNDWLLLWSYCEEKEKTKMAT